MSVQPFTTQARLLRNRPHCSSARSNLHCGPRPRGLPKMHQTLLHRQAEGAANGPVPTGKKPKTSHLGVDISAEASGGNPSGTGQGNATFKDPNPAVYPPSTSGPGLALGRRRRHRGWLPSAWPAAAAKSVPGRPHSPPLHRTRQPGVKLGVNGPGFDSHGGCFCIGTQTASRSDPPGAGKQAAVVAKASPAAPRPATRAPKGRAARCSLHRPRPGARTSCSPCSPGLSKGVLAALARPGLPNAAERRF